VESVTPTFEIDDKLFSESSFVRVFGKPISHKGRRMAVLLVSGKDSLKRAKEMIKGIKIV
jgi:phosphoribosylglycinamide formyltransferase 2